MVLKQGLKISNKYIFGAYLSKIVCVLLIVWTILKRENHISLRTILRNGRAIKMRFTLYLQCCCDVLWSWVASCRPGPWLKPLGFSYTPCEGTESQIAGIRRHRLSDLSHTPPKETHLYRPDFFTSSYVSFPSTVRVISSEATVKTWDSTRI